MYKIITKFEEFQEINEARLRVKRKYRDRPNVYVNSKAKIRNSVLEFVGNKEKVTDRELKEFFETMEESVGKKPSSSWLKNNKELFNKKYSDGQNYYSLSKKGQRILDSFKKIGLDEKEEIEERDYLDGVKKYSEEEEEPEEEKEVVKEEKDEVKDEVKEEKEEEPEEPEEEEEEQSEEEEEPEEEEEEQSEEEEEPEEEEEIEESIDDIYKKIMK